MKTEKGPVTLTKTAEILNATANQSELRIIIEGVKRLREKCRLTIYTESSYVAAGFRELSRWKENGWRTSRNKEVANREEWQEIAEILSEHEVTVVTAAEHEYRTWLRGEVARKGK